MVASPPVRGDEGERREEGPEDLTAIIAVDKIEPVLSDLWKMIEIN